MSERQQKITFAHMRAAGVRELLLYCSDYHCSHSIATGGCPWPDDARISDLEPRFVCSACGKRGAEVRPDFSWNKVTTPHDGLSVNPTRRGVGNAEKLPRT